MPRWVRSVGATVGTKTLDIEERQVLLQMDDDEWHLHILHVRVDGSKWVTSGADGEVALDDMSEHFVVPLSRNAAFPAEGRPFCIPDAYDANALRALRSRAIALAEIHGWKPPTAGAAQGGDRWYYADTAISKFGEEIPAHIVGDGANVRIEGSAGLFLVDLEDGNPARYVFGERVLQADVDDWLAAKLSGAGRDERLLPSDPGRGTHVSLLRSVIKDSDSSAVPDKEFFEGPSALGEVVKSVDRSGLEFVGWGLAYLKSSGLGEKAGLAVEFMVHVYTLFYLWCVDLLDGRRLACAEHVARRLLMIQKAVRRCPRQPDFDGLSIYGKHMVDSTGAVVATTFDKFVAESQRNDAQTMKQDRLNREEHEHDQERRKKKNKDKDKKED